MVTSKAKTESKPSFVSTQVTDARRYFLDLTPDEEKPITIVCGGRERVSKDYVVRRTTFPYLCVEFVAEGHGSVELNHKKYPLRPGAVFAYMPNIAHCIRTSSTDPMLKYYIDFTGSEGAKLLRESSLRGDRAIYVSNPEEFVGLFEMFLKEGMSGETHGQDLCAALLPVLFLKLSQRAMPGNVRQPRAYFTYLEARDFIEKEFRKYDTIEEVAEELLTNPASLCRLFRRFGETTPYRLLIRLKIQEAASMLVDQQMMVKEIAAELGFADQFHFSRVFKRVYGLSPEKFSRQSQWST
ncbi:AraC family transcriptional regulator [Calycomorphotria hydatis]|uniref:Arabinose operon regulatory protein n=1 Tax=Calycomorphotria hydatis TaxID=2528027 RepID=A0A517TAS8_9PLAN|nr:AraC family transcriptional regulator [Calycomorphotria hydatis]QDT65477.1 Arabinose operon regulatory protein [Calycomorphotria hydatis]